MPSLAGRWLVQRRKSSLIVTLGSYFLMCHPFTSIAVATTTLMFALLINGNFSHLQLTALWIAMLLVQFSIGLTNDLFDYDYDTKAKSWKPLVSRLTIRSITWMLVAVFLSIGLLMNLFLSLQAIPFYFVCLAIGLSYNIRLKRTSWSWLPYSLAIPTILMYVYSAKGSFSIDLLWLYLVGMLLGPAMNIANQLQEAEQAYQSGERSLVHVLGIRFAGRTSVILLLATWLLPTLVIISGSQVNLSFLILSAIYLCGLIMFLLLHETQKREYLWPLAIVLVTILGLIAMPFVN